MTFILVITVWLSVIVFLSLRDRQPLKSRWLPLIRALLPSWRFFDRLEQVPKVFYRVRAKGGEFGEWQPLPPPKPRSWTALFVNPDGNLSFAVNSLTEHLVADVNECTGPGEIEKAVSMQLKKRVIRSYAGEEFQFKISIFDTRTKTWSGDLLEGSSRDTQ